MKYEIKTFGIVRESGDVADNQSAVDCVVRFTAFKVRYCAAELFLNDKLIGLAEISHYNADTMASRIVFTDYVTSVRETYTVTPTIQIVNCEPYRVEEQRQALAAAGF